MQKTNNRQKSFNIPRQQHFIPRFYLEYFTDSEDKDRSIWVFDKDKLKQWKTIPEKTARQKDFYRIEVPDLEPDIVEKTFSEIEGKAASVINDILRDKTLPSGEEFGILLNFVALLAVRIPRFREIFSGPMEDMGKFTLKMMLDNPTRWKNIKEKMKRDGRVVDNSVGYDDMKKFVKNDNFSLKVSQEWHIKTLVDCVNIIIPLLFDRNWSLVISKDTENEFILSDSPVALWWTVPMPPLFSPGFETLNTELTVPLSKHLALISSLERESRIFLTGRKFVAMINYRTIEYGQRFLYSPRQDFIWCINEKIENLKSLITALKIKSLE